MPVKTSLPVKSETGIPVARLFKDVPVEIQQALLKSAFVVPLEKGERLFEHGDQGGTMYLVQKGRIEISLITDEGKKLFSTKLAWVTHLAKLRWSTKARAQHLQSPSKIRPSSPSPV